MLLGRSIVSNVQWSERKPGVFEDLLDFVKKPFFQSFDCGLLFHSIDLSGKPLSAKVLNHTSENIPTFGLHFNHAIQDPCIQTQIDSLINRCVADHNIANPGWQSSTPRCSDG